MDSERIIEALEETNKWWKRGFEIEFRPREVYEEIKRFLKTRQIIALTGLRRVGKTTIMLKMVRDNIEKFGPENIMYFSFDDFRDVRIKDVLNAYSRLVNKELGEGEYLVLFDEIQKVAGWEEQIKRVYDNFKNIKLIISGSESLFISNKSRESLAGRFFEFKIQPLSFREYLTFKGRRFENVELYKQEILREFDNFLLCNGFPEIASETEEVVKKYIKENIIEKIVYRDIPQIFPVREPAILEEVLRIILLSPGEIINIDDMAKDLNISRQTLSNYLNYLEKSYLIKKLYNFSGSARKTQRKLKKYYPTVVLPEIVRKHGLRGRVFETAMVLQLNADFFWRDVYKNEVDVVKHADGKIIPIEIKYSKLDIKPLRTFMKKFRIDKGIILTYDKEGKAEFDKGRIEIVPFYKYMLK